MKRNAMKTVGKRKEKGDTERRYKVVKLTRNWCQLPASWHSSARRVFADTSKRRIKQRERANQGMSTDKQLLHLPTEVATAPKSVRSGGERTRRFNHNRTRLKATATSSQSENGQSRKVLKRANRSIGQHKRDQLDVNAPRRSRIENLTSSSRDLTH